RPGVGFLPQLLDQGFFKGPTPYNPHPPPKIEALKCFSCAPQLEALSTPRPSFGSARKRMATKSAGSRSAMTTGRLPWRPTTACRDGLRSCSTFWPLGISGPARQRRSADLQAVIALFDRAAQHLTRAVGQEREEAERGARRIKISRTVTVVTLG